MRNLGFDMETDRRLVEEYLDRLLQLPDAVSSGMVPAGPVLEAVRYAVLGAGQRLRPLLALRTARMLGAECAGTLRAAAAVELLHCASLIVDDLPCMDNSPLRRGRPSTHVAFGEPVAVLASFAIVALAGRMLLEGDLNDYELRALAGFQRKLLLTLDCNSLIAGQAMDVQMTGELRERSLPQISDLKTVPLFELAVMAGAVFAEMDDSRNNALLSFGREFGRAYQLVDDLLDGEVTDAELVYRQLAAATDALRMFGPGARALEEPGARALEEMVEYLHGKAIEAHCCHR